MMPTDPTRRAKPSEEGFILVSVMFLIALLIIAMAVAIPKISADIQRDREVETFHRGLQYRRAVQLYYRKFQRYPPNLDALVKTNNLRFLRKRYIDPITRKDDWKPIMFGQQKTPLAMGFFGQPLMGVGFGGQMLGGVGPQGGNGIAGANPIAGGMGGIDAGQNGLNGQNAGGDPTAGAGQNGGANPTDPTQIAGANPLPGGQTFGGAGIVGFSPASEKQSILVYKKKNHYNQWEFTYSPLSDMGLGGFQQGPPQLMPGPGAPGTGGMGSTPAPTQAPTPAPQQQ